MKPGIIIGGVAIAATAAIVGVANAKATAEDLRVTVEGMKPFSWKRDVKAMQATIRLNIGFGNARGGRIKVEAMDLDAYIDKDRVGGIRNYSFDLSIEPVALTLKEVELKLPLTALGKALGTRIIAAILGGKDDVVRSLWPKEMALRGPIRANGMTFQLDHTIPFTLA